MVATLHSGRWQYLFRAPEEVGSILPSTETRYSAWQKGGWDIILQVVESRHERRKDHSLSESQDKQGHPLDPRIRTWRMLSDASVCYTSIPRESNLLPAEEWLHIFSFLSHFSKLGFNIRTRASHKLGKCSTTELYSQPYFNSLMALMHFNAIICSDISSIF